jgi:hypothetical protein
MKDSILKGQPLTSDVMKTVKGGYDFYYLLEPEYDENGILVKPICPLCASNNLKFYHEGEKERILCMNCGGQL